MSFNPMDFKPGDRFRATMTVKADGFALTNIHEGLVEDVDERLGRVYYGARMDDWLSADGRVWERLAPAEPTGLGAVVRVDGEAWARIIGGSVYAWIDPRGDSHAWDQLLDRDPSPEVLFEGVAE